MPTTAAGRTFGKLPLLTFVIGLAACSIWMFARVIRQLYGRTERLGLMYASINH